MSAPSTVRTRTPLFRSVSRMLPPSSKTTSTSIPLSESRLSFGDGLLDGVFKGGVYTGGVVEVCGESASGKTQLCLQLCLSALRSGISCEQLGTTSSKTVSPSGLSDIERKDCPTLKPSKDPCVLFVSTEDPFPSKRLQQLAQHSPIVMSSGCTRPSSFWTNNVLVDHIGEYDQLLHCLRVKIPALIASRDVRLVVIDSVAAIFRCYEKSEIKNRWKHLGVLGKELHLLSGRNPGLCVLCVNQVTSVMSDRAKTTGGCTRQLAPALGLTWANIITTRFVLSRLDRTITMTEDMTGNGSNNNNHDSNPAKRRVWEATLRAIEVSLSPDLPNVRCDVIIDKFGFKGIP